jgi:hypothetical protein
MPTLKNVRHEKFCQGVASGLSHSESYRRICGNNRNTDVHGAERMKRPGVRERVAELQKEHDSKSKLSREEALEWLSNLIRTPIGSVGKDSPLVQA